ncbi:sterol desaturase family protein [Sediminicola luteus]|uniref:Sterol desaturase n=1 Tax=Sediminicola luteus TaxID=319238 RepID=A0A2A4G9N2_9FLAO|nr:sterol desaturase family protein [Sediminicola luteus]PCE64475.1 sterol desaturase [Sediminicola luteus]
MEAIYNYFETIPTLHRSLILVGGIAFFWIVESIIPMFRFGYKKWRHAGINFFFTLTTILVNFPLAFLLLKTSDWTQVNHFGVLQWLDMPLWADLLVGLMLMDLIGAYTAHLVEHKTKVLWGFHLVHHTDQEIDTTTANRHHPGESIIRFAFTALATFIVGAPVALIMLYQSLSVVLSQFNHANFALPKGLDTALSYVIVSPDMHKVHHHYQLPYTDSNYGNIFSIWDRLFGTYMSLPNADLKYGVDTHMERENHYGLGRMLKIPFEKYKGPGSEI